MKKFLGTLLPFFLAANLLAQNPNLPTDFRQHNLTEYNASLLNPAFSLDRNNASSVAFWSRWQWQAVDADPTSLFLNYTARINAVSTAGVGFFQHNTGIFTNTGGILNYAYELQFSQTVSLGVGLNLFGYSQKLTDDRFVPPNPLLPEITTDFVLQFSPGLNLKIDRFSIGVVSENLFDYNFTLKERNTVPEDRIIMGLASYDFPIALFGQDNGSVLRPTVYARKVPDVDTQIGFMGLLSTNKFWVQGGYNSFYGVSFGAGGRFFKRLSFGALVEFGTNADLEGLDPSFEVVTAYKLGSAKASPETLEEELIAEKEKEQEKIKEEMANAEALSQQRAEEGRKELQANNEREKQDLMAAALLEQRKQDSLAREDRERKAAALALEQKRVQDSVAKAVAAKKEEVAKPKPGERYEEVAKEGSLAPGYYLIANVFGTQRYFEAFMADLKKKGLDPKSFYRQVNKYNYVYLDRYDTFEAARTARDSKFNGKYAEKTWIFRVVGE